MSTISAEKAYKLVQGEQAIIIDVREFDEFKTCHIPGSYSLPLAHLQRNLQNFPQKKKKILLVCASGHRSKKGKILCKNVQSGESNVMIVEGGIRAWKQSNFPLLTFNQSSHAVSVFRQVQMIVGGAIALLAGYGFLGNSTVSVIGTGFLGTALCLAGMTGWCGLGILLSKMPWNK